MNTPSEQAVPGNYSEYPDCREPVNAARCRHLFGHVM